MVMSPSAIDIGPASGPEAVLRPEQSSKQQETARQNPEHEEYQYLDLIHDILESGEHRPDRYDNHSETALLRSLKTS